MKAIKNSDTDWHQIETEYRAGQLSIRMMATLYGVPESSIRYKAKSCGWKRDLKETVQIEVRNRLLRNSLRTSDPSQEGRPVNDVEIVEAAAERGVALLEAQRVDIENLRNREQQLLNMLTKGPKKLWVGQFQGQVITHQHEMDLLGQAQILNALANVMTRRIALERQAYNLDDHDRQAGKVLLVLD